jgi:MerR family mercuric resistance operon transcriptional regulator
MTNKMTIGKVATYTGVAADTLRFYERKGLIKQPARNASGYRIYAPESIERILFIKRARQFGLTLSDIGGLVSIMETGPRPGCAIRQSIRSRIVAIDGDIRHLQETRARLSTLADACADHAHCGDCHLAKVIAQTPMPTALQAGEPC